MDWTFEDKEVTGDMTDGYVAFVYVIENLIDGRKYIGKKTLTKTRRKPVKGKVRKKKVVTESDWRNYFGSNLELIADVEKHGQENFRRTIVRFCKKKGEASYYESKMQFENDVLLSDLWYNSWIAVKVHKSHLAGIDA